MKLSELFKTPFKLKGGSTLNLRGFSKRVVDKEVGGNNTNSNAFTNIINYILDGCPIYPHPSKIFNDSTHEIEDIQSLGTNGPYNFLYKKLDIDNISSDIRTQLIYNCTFNNEQIIFNTGLDGESIPYEIDGEDYIYLKSGIA